MLVPVEIVDDVGYPFLNQQPRFLGLELEWYAEEDILLRDLGEGADEDAEDVVLAAEPGDGGGVVEEVALQALGDAGDGEGEGWGGMGGGWHGWFGGGEGLGSCL